MFVFNFRSKKYMGIFLALLGILPIAILQSTEVDKQAASKPINGQEDLFTYNNAHLRPYQIIQSFEEDEDYIRGYLQACLDVNFGQYGVIVKVKDKQILLENLPSPENIANHIIEYLKGLPFIKEKESQNKLATSKEVLPELVIKDGAEQVNPQKLPPSIKGEWFPQSGPLFPAFIADPRQTCCALAYRLGDEILDGNGVEVILAGDLPIFRWYDVGPKLGDLQLGIEAGVWGIFDTKLEGSTSSDLADLINTDFRLNIPLTYAFEKWAFRARLHHTSSHLGDELMNRYPNLKRKNLSREAFDLFVSHQLTRKLMIYGGAGVFFHVDKEFKTKPLYVEYGGEYKFFKKNSLYNKVYMEPFFATYIRNWQDFNWAIDFTGALGFEFGGLQGLGRKLRAFIEYHNGYSLEGQFSHQKTSYCALKLVYGF